VFLALSYGAALYIISDDQKKDPAAMETFLRDNHIDYISVPVTYLKLLRFEKLPELKTMLTGAEPVAAETIYGLPRRITYHNAYGPTEASVCSSIFTYSYGREIPAGNVPIGIPIPNVVLYILDDNRQVVPIGIEGELYIGGVGLARGYLNNPGLTNEKFLGDPFREGGQMYRTGDRVRWLPDGNIEFIGRRDEQVKIRGYRIEAGEIEMALQDHPDIDAAFVMARVNPQGENELVAYVVTNEPLNKSSIRSHIGRTLPSYMLPAHIIPIEAIPMTAHGKVDRSRLPEPGQAEREAGDKYVAPQTATEARMTKIWEDILSRERIGILDDYFELGGNSLKAMQVAKKILEEMEVSVSVKTIFSQNTVQHISAHIDGLLSAPASSSSSWQNIQGEQREAAMGPPAEKPTTIPASYNQLFYFSPLYTGGSTVTLTYEREQLDVDLLRTALLRLIERHEILRTTFVRDGGQVWQKVRAADEVTVEIPEVVTISREEWNDVIANQRATDMDISDPILLKVRVYRLEKEGYGLLLSLHHALTDGYSNGILEKELTTLYDTAAGQAAASLKPLSFQYGDYAIRQHEFLRSEAGERYRAYWLKKLSGFRKPVWTVAPRMEDADKPLQYLNKPVHGPLCEDMDRFVRANGLTRPSLLMGTLVLLLNKLSGRQDITLLTNVIGRNSSCYGELDVSSLIGFFANLLLVRHRLTAEDRVIDFLLMVRDGFLEDLNFEAYPFLELIDHLPGVSRQGFLEDTVFFNYHNYDYLHGRGPDPEEMESSGKMENAVPEPRALGLIVYDHGRSLRLQFLLNPNRFPVQDVEEFGELYTALLRQLIDAPLLPLRKIETQLFKIV
jgi:hypothetical protein